MVTAFVMSGLKGKSSLCKRITRLVARLCGKKEARRVRVAHAFRMSTTFNSSLSNAEVEVSSFMRQLNTSKLTSLDNPRFPLRLNKAEKMRSLASGRSFYRQLLQKHAERRVFTCMEEYLEVAGVPILSGRMRVPQSREEREKQPSLRRRMNTI